MFRHTLEQTATKMKAKVISTIILKINSSQCIFQISWTF